MRDNHLFRWFYVLLIISCFFTFCTDGKGFGGRGGGFGGGKSGGSFGGSKGAGTFGGSSSYNRMNSYGSRSGSSFRSNAMSFGAGALGGVAAYSLMRSMSSSYYPGYYQPGYGIGETCVNNEDMNGTRFGRFRCPLNGFPLEAKYCCGEYGKQYCCIRDGSSRVSRATSNFGWILLVIVIFTVIIFLLIRHRRRNQKDVIMIPMEPPIDEQQQPPFYQPPPPPMGYPPPPMSYPPPPMSYPPPPTGYAQPPSAGNPYAVPPQNYNGEYNPYQMPYPPQQQTYNPYQVKEAGPPAYDDAVRNNQGGSTAKPI